MLDDSGGRSAPEASFRRVTVLVLTCLLLCLTVLLGRVVQLQLLPGEALKAQMTPRVTVKKQPGLRGDVLDRAYRPLAVTRFATRIVVDPTLLPEATLDKAIVKLAAALGEPADDVGTKIRKAQATNATRDALRGGPVKPGVGRLSDVQGGPSVLGSPVREGSDGGETPAPVAEVPDVKVPGPIRYLPLGGLIDDEHATAVRDVVKEFKLKGVTFERKPVRDATAGAEVAPLLGKVGFEEKKGVWLEDVGVMGAERLLEPLLTGQPGSIRYVRDAGGRPLWMDPGSVRPGTSGADVRLSLDVELQRMAYAELMQGVLDQDAQGGRLVMADPSTGEILAMVDIVRDVQGAQPFPWVDIPPPRVKGKPAQPEARMQVVPGRRYRIIPDDPARRIHPALARNRCIEDMYEPGSTFKPFVWSTINELHLIRLDEVIDTEGGRWTLPIGRHLEDVVKRDHQTWYEVLVNSSNIGMVKGAARLTPRQLHDACTRFGFGRPTGLGLPGRPVPGESAGAVTPLDKWTRFTHTSVPYGHEIAVTPVQMVRAFSAFARSRAMAGTLPRLRLDAVSEGEPEGVIYRVLPAEYAIGVREPLSKVAEKMQETMKTSLRQPVPEGGWRYRIFGKSGTADVPLGPAPKGKKAPKGASGYYDDHFNSSFIAAGPIEDPRIVVVVVIDDPRGPKGLPASGDRRLRYGASAAGPVVRRVMERALTYLGAPPSAPVAPAPQ